MTSDPESITISGPTSLINKISSVVAKVDVTNMRNSGTVTADLMIIDKNQDEMPESQMEFLNFDSGSRRWMWILNCGAVYPVLS